MDLTSLSQWSRLHCSLVLTVVATGVGFEPTHTLQGRTSYGFRDRFLNQLEYPALKLRSISRGGAYLYSIW